MPDTRGAHVTETWDSGVASETDRLPLVPDRTTRNRASPPAFRRRKPLSRIIGLVVPLAGPFGGGQTDEGRGAGSPTRMHEKARGLHQRLARDKCWLDQRMNGASDRTNRQACAADISPFRVAETSPRRLRATGSTTPFVS